MSYSLKTILRYVQEQLRVVQIDDFVLESELIVSEIMKIPRLEIIINKFHYISAEAEMEILSATTRRCKREPLQYIFKKAYFRNICLKVGEGVLIPRPETEILVELALKLLPNKGSLCDIGTGSGAISISIACEKKDCKIWGLDISNKALEYAKFNKKKYQLENLTLCQSDLFNTVKNLKFDIITANLPYISEEEYKTLDCEVCNFEPKLALTADNNGLSIIEKVANDATNYLKANGSIIFEIGHTQAKDVKKILLDMRVWRNIKIYKDFNNIKRFVIGIL